MEMPPVVADSTLQGVMWPALPSPTAASLLSMQFQFSQSERLSCGEIQQQQLKQLHALLDHAIRTVSYYRSLSELQRINLSRPGISIDEWQSIPVLQRWALQRHSADLTSTAIPKEHGDILETGSSGSTGLPVNVYVTDMQQFMWYAQTLREHEWHGRNHRKKLASIRYTGDSEEARSPPGIRSAGWGHPIDEVYSGGMTVMLSIECDVADQLRWLLDEQPDYLLTYPSNLRALAELMDQSDAELQSIEQIRTIGEVLTAEDRAYCEKVFDTSIADIYSAMEVGNIAFQCPEHGSYHVCSETMLVEVLNDEYQPCKSRETGRVVVTPLHNFAMPLIRYEIGDYAEVGEPCACGRGSLTLKRILGRTRNMLKLPDGSSHWPVFSTRRITEIAPVTQLQLAQIESEVIEVRLVADRELNTNEQQTISDMLTKELRHAFEFRFVYPDEIERSPTGKYEDFKSEL